MEELRNKVLSDKKIDNLNDIYDALERLNEDLNKNISEKRLDEVQNAVKSQYNKLEKIQKKDKKDIQKKMHEFNKEINEMNMKREQKK